MFVATVEAKVIGLVPPAVKVKAAAEVRAKVPDVAVWMVRFPAVLVQAEVPPEAKVMAPVELPRVVVDPAPVE